MQESNIKLEIELKYNVSLYPEKVKFHKSIIEYYSAKKKLSDTQINRLKNPLYPIPGVTTK